ncbi:pentatricopeptide repeat-containing protein At1g11290, chloroplastic-like [Selaginella moellendorffii]|uniref:pentatricopeptide repeat-containing protein At1g11290, chloroplastic-like n=1 Tax=Selaginella moellendorffii TaxID=88036 RepID=UPI000D1C6450|nr:pentatricopeptide repeat-containing protein At1g11290, chloroplastic-like [Selaginella moellendorffii]|eukprot:XP_024525971.1 pentatricopeptide repeat-containing protein At1g11290, chloroplastic-like [Selaginella moellendorffii]
MFSSCWRSRVLVSSVGRHQPLFGSFVCLREHDIEPSFSAALKSCTVLRDCEIGKRIHSNTNADNTDVFLATALVTMYAKCGSMANACMVFEGMPHRDVVSWNALMMGHISNGQAELALEQFARMQTSCQPNARSFVAALAACATMAEKEDGQGKQTWLEKGVSISSSAAASNLVSNLYVASSLVELYSKCGAMVDARRVFDRIESPDVVTWTTLMVGYADSGDSEMALVLFQAMQSRGVAPDAQACVAALRACSNLSAREDGREVDGKLVKMEYLERGMALHSLAARNGYQKDIFVASSLIDMYSKCGSLEDAWMAFSRMLRHDVVSLTAMVLGCEINGEPELALELFERMVARGLSPNLRSYVAALMACASSAAKKQSGGAKDAGRRKECLEKGRAIHLQCVSTGCDTNVFVANTLIDMYAKCGSLEDARAVFDSIPDRNVISWNALLAGYVENGESRLALELFSRMEADQAQGYALLDARTLTAAVKASSILVAVESGKRAHGIACRTGVEDDTGVAVSLVHFYGKCGITVIAQQLFDSLSGYKDTTLWNALMTGYSNQGDAERVFSSFARMRNEGLRGDGITSLLLLAACSHAGLVDKGREIFESLPLASRALGHYTCMVDLLGRSNQLEAAMGLIASMPWQPDLVTWMTLLGSCKKWSNMEVARVAFQELVRIDSREESSYLVMANIYASHGLLDESSKVLELRDELLAR